jgi:DNA-binding NtrC family response regulator
LAENLREDGWIVHAYDRLPGGSELARLPAVDVLVTDPSDPCHGGLGFAESWHRIYPHVPVLVVTTDLARAWDVWANCRGGVEVRRKPIDYGRIRAALQALCPRLSPA